MGSHTLSSIVLQSICRRYRIQLRICSKIRITAICIVYDKCRLDGICTRIEFIPCPIRGSIGHHYLIILMPKHLHRAILAIYTA